MTDVLQDGMFCTHCEWFEQPEDEDGATCPACGCPMDAHVSAQVVALP